MTGPKKTVAEAVIDALQEVGVRWVFGVPSGGWVDYMEALRRRPGIEFILATHEGGAGFMADVSARLTGVPGVCFGTFGPGATNLATGVGCALLDRSPVIALTDEMPAAWRGRTVQMGIDHQALFTPLTKRTTRLSPDAVRSVIFEAASIALSERPGPVHVGLPAGLSAAPAPAETVSYRGPAAIAVPALAAREKLQRLVAASRRPVLAIGIGAVRAGVQAELQRLAEQLRMPVVLTPMAKGMLPESHPCYVGVVFHALCDRVGAVIGDADLLVAVGYDPVEFNLETWMPAAPLANVDTVPADVDPAIVDLAVDVTGDIATTVRDLLASPSAPKLWDLERLRAHRAAMFAALAPATNTFGPCRALDELRAVLPPEGIMVCDVGAHTHLIGQKWLTPACGTQIMTNGWSAMGFGVPGAVAAKLCRPHTPVCAVVGDGGFLMTAGELAVAVRERLAIVFVVLTDNDLALIRIKQERKGNPIYGTPIRARGGIGGPDIFGVPVATAASPEEFRAALETAFSRDGPSIVEAVIDSREYDELVLRKSR